MKILIVLHTVLYTLLIGWLSAALIGGMLALLQYQEVVRYFPADQVAAEFQARLDREVWHGSLLLFVQVGIIGAVMWWLLNRQPLSPSSGLLCGIIVALVEASIGWQLGMPPLFLVPLAISLVVVGWLANLPAHSPTDLPTTSA
jgi:hypothetical protein